MSKKSGVGKFIAGAAIGAGLGILFAPKKGSETRKKLKLKFEELLNSVKELDKDDVKMAIEEKINEVKKDLEDLDKEKVLKIAKKKSEEIKEKLDDLYELAKKKATPVVEGAVEDLRNSAIKVTKEVLTKLEKVEK